jgi:hypothetical protein
MTDEILLVGSVPLDTVEQVFRTVGGPLGPFLAYMPDGEVGDRRYWIDGIAYRVLNGHPDIETLRRPAPDENGIERWRPQGIHDQFQFRVKPGVSQVRFGDPGWRLGYTRDAVNSYFVFRHLKKEGLLPGAVRFQVCLPLTYSAVTSFFPDPEDHARILAGFTAALRAEVAKMAEQIESPSEPGPFRYALANAGDCFVDGTLSEQCRATQHAYARAETEVGFAADSPVEGDGFEPSVPRRRHSAVRARTASMEPNVGNRLYGKSA